MGRGDPNWDPIEVARSILRQAGMNRSHRDAIEDLIQVAELAIERATVYNELMQIKELLNASNKEVAGDERQSSGVLQRRKD